MALSLGSRLVGTHFVTSKDSFINHSKGSILHCLEHLLFLEDGKLLIQLSASLILTLKKLAVL